MLFKGLLCNRHLPGLPPVWKPVSGRRQRNKSRFLRNAISKARKELQSHYCDFPRHLGSGSPYRPAEGGPSEARAAGTLTPHSTWGLLVRRIWELSLPEWLCPCQLDGHCECLLGPIRSSLLPELCFAASDGRGSPLSSFFRNLILQAVGLQCGLPHFINWKKNIILMTPVASAPHHAPCPSCRPQGRALSLWPGLCD